MHKQPKGIPYRGGSHKKIAVSLPIVLFDWVRQQAIENDRTFSEEIAQCVSTARTVVAESDAEELV